MNPIVKRLFVTGFALAALSAWGSWFAAPGPAVGETAGGRSHLYFPQLVARHCVAAATDVEVALGTLFGWS